MAARPGRAAPRGGGVAVFVVLVRYGGRDRGVRAGVSYISHREEALPQGRTRELFGMGDRYRALCGDERAIAKLLRDDGAHLKDPRYFRFVMTVDDATARKLGRLSRLGRERTVRDAVERTFRGTLRLAQGTFVLHEHGGKDRPWGHPHVHVHLSPILVNGQAYRRIPPLRLAAFKMRWERDLKRELARALVREDRVPSGPMRGLMAERQLRWRRPDPSLLAQARRGLLTLQRWRSRGPLREFSPLADSAVRAAYLAARAGASPGGFLAHEALKRMLRSLPDRARSGVEITRLISRVIPR